MPSTNTIGIWRLSREWTTVSRIATRHLIGGKQDHKTSPKVPTSLLIYSLTFLPMDGSARDNFRIDSYDDKNNLRTPLIVFGPSLKKNLISHVVDTRVITSYVTASTSADSVARLLKVRQLWRSSTSWAYSGKCTLQLSFPRDMTSPLFGPPVSPRPFWI